MNLKKQKKMKEQSEKQSGLAQQEQLESGGNALYKDESSSSTSVKYEDVEDTFFTLIKLDNEVRIAIGNSIVSKKSFTNVKEAKKYINEKPWELIGVSAMLLASNFINRNK